MVPMTVIHTSVSLPGMATGTWTDEENDLIVADYFEMLADDLAGRPYTKADHNRRIWTRLNRRRPSIEFKHRNISAVLKGLGETWLIGYLPAFSIQMSLADAVARWLRRHPEFQTPAPLVDQPADIPRTAQLVIELPSTLRKHPPPDDLDQMQAIARKFDVAARVERNGALGRAGKQRVLAHERATLAHIPTGAAATGRSIQGNAGCLTNNRDTPQVSRQGSVRVGEATSRVSGRHRTRRP